LIQTQEKWSFPTKTKHQPNINNGPVKCTHCKKPGQTVKKCFKIFPGLRNPSQKVIFVNETVTQRTRVSIWKEQKENSRLSNQNSFMYKEIPIAHQTLQHLQKTNSRLLCYSKRESLYQTTRNNNS
jgi:hypothetical protein